MTGIEAVSNGVSAFRDPVVKHAHRTLGAICAVLGIFLAGIAYLAQAYRIGAMDLTQDGYQSVVSQLAGAIVGHDIFYYVTIASLLCVLALSANTSFVGFPRLCRLVAQDDFLPRPFAVVGRRLVFSVGILYLDLAVTSGFLLAVFGGITDRLIPLFAIGAFLTFTLSQAGMVVHWRRELRMAQTSGERRKRRTSLAINGIGAMTTGAALSIIVAAKFAEGAWITVLALPCVIVQLKTIHRYYDILTLRLRDDGPLDLRRCEAPIVLVVTEGWSRLTDKALSFALSISPDVVAVHLTNLGGPDAEEKTQPLRAQWAIDVERPVREAGLRPPRLVMIPAPFRRIHVPLLELIERLQADNPIRTIAVLIPEVVKLKWWQHLLHTHRARRLRNALLRYGGSDLLVVNAPWYLEEPKIQEALVPEERYARVGRDGE
jgi:hypothetical protein